MNLRDRMPNGAAVDDWLGTAMTAANLAGGYVRDVRAGSWGKHGPEVVLRDALRYAEQAADELRAVLRHVGEPVETLTIERALLARLMAAIETPGDLSADDLTHLLTDADLIYHGGPT